MPGQILPPLLIIKEYLSVRAFDGIMVLVTRFLIHLFSNQIGLLFIE